MKNITRFFGVLVAGILLVGMANNSTLADTKGKPKLEFKAEKNRIQLDTMYLSEMDDEVNIEIEFENTGDQPLIVNKVTGCCGTQIKYWPKQPILPGKEGTIQVYFRVPPRPHQISRTVKAISNDPEGAKTLRIQGIVKEKDDGSIKLGNN